MKYSFLKKILSTALACSMLVSTPGQVLMQSNVTLYAEESTEMDVYSEAYDSGDSEEYYDPAFSEDSVDDTDPSEYDDSLYAPEESYDPGFPEEYDAEGLPGMDEQIAENEEDDSWEEEEEDVLVDRTLKVSMRPQKVYEHDKVPTDKLKTVDELWQWLYGRDAEPDTNPSGDALSVKIQGELPEDVSAEAGFILFDEAKDYPERAIASIDIKLLRADGSEYIPESDLKVTIGGSSIKRVFNNGNPYILVYAHNEDGAAEALIVDVEEFSSHVTVYRELPQSSHEAQSEYWTKRAERLAYVEGHDHERISFYEDEDGLKMNQSKKNIKFKVEDGKPLHFIVSAQNPDAAEPEEEESEPLMPVIQIEDLDQVDQTAEEQSDAIVPDETEIQTEEVVPIEIMEETETAEETQHDLQAEIQTETAVSEAVEDIFETEAAPETEIVIETEAAAETEAVSETELLIETEAVETEIAAKTEAVPEPEIVIETEAVTEGATEAAIVIETEAIDETETTISSEVETEAATENIIETETEAETEAETESESVEEELVNRNLRVRTDEGSLVSVSGLMPADVTAQVQNEDAVSYSEELEGEGLLAVDISLSREAGASEAASEEQDQNIEIAESEEYQPQAPVRVMITDPAIGDAEKSGSELEVYHIADDGTATKVENVRYIGNSAVFYADGFSVYVVTYTVDFHWGEYNYSIKGESEIRLSELFEKLGVTEINLSDVTDVSFSNPELVEVTKIDGNEEQTADWLLKSLAPFNTEEFLTLTLNNGETVEIKVTDADYNVYNNSNAVIGSWTLDTEGVLTVTGTGAMKDYNNSPWVAGTPWFEYIVKDSTHSNPPVTKIVITDGITRIGTNSFTRTYNLNEIDASNCTSLTAIGGSAFKQQSSSSASNNTANPKIINFSGCENLTTIETDAFRECKGIEELDISGTKLGASYITKAGAGFGASTTSLKVLRANACTTDFETLDLSGRTNLQTVELSGCTNLTGMNLPDSVKTLDISGCTGLTSLTAPSGVTSLNVSESGLTSLDVSACTGLTTLDVSGTALTSLTVPSGVTSLNVSGTGLTSLDVSACTGLTTLEVSGTSLASLTVPSSVTSLNASNCTNLTVLDLSKTSITSIDVSGNTSLTALKLPATVTTLNVTGCPDLVIYFDGKAEELPGEIPADSLVSWGDYTYLIKKNSTATLDEIFTACGITAIGSEAVQSISVSDPGVLEVTDLMVNCLDAFTGLQTLTVTLTNGMTGTIKVEYLVVEEKDNLNLFLDSNTVYSYEGETDPYELSVPAILKDGDALNLTLSFSEIPEGEEGERQMTLLGAMTYTFPDGLTVSNIPNSVTLNVLSGGDNYTFPATVSISETGALTVTGNYGEQQAVVSASTMASFNMSVTVKPDTIPHEYNLGNDMKLMTAKPRNVKVSSFTAGDDYDAETGTVTYTLTVEAESDLDTDEQEYPVSIIDSTTGDVSGRYTYTQENKPDDKPATEIDGVEVSTETPTEFTGFPLTVAHMYDGDKITLTYRAKPQHGSYDRETQMVSLENTVTIDNNGNPSNDPDDDTASATTGSISYEPLTREYVTQDGSWAYWQVTVNPDGYTLNGGEDLTLADTFDDDYPTKQTKMDADQSIDYSSVKIRVNSQPDTSGIVTYDYSGNTGTFVIPDKTPVIITYRTRVTALPGEAKTFRGTAVLRDSEENEVAASTAGAIREAVEIYPGASDVGGFGDNFMVRLYVYGEGQMQKGIEGATFILLDSNHRALEYKVGENKGQPVTFTTGADGYANIELHEEEGDVTIEKNTGYYLELAQAVDGYQKDNTLYSFMIIDDPAYSSGDFYKYYNGDTMKVRLYPPTPGLSVSIRFSGGYTLSEEQQNNVTAVLQKLDENENWVEVERHPYTDTQMGSIRFEESLFDADLDYQNLYRVVEENQNPWDLPENIYLKTTYYSTVGAVSAEPGTDPQEFYLKNADDSVSVVIDNRYEDPQLTIVKMDKSTGEALPGAVFSVYKIVNGVATGDVVTNYTTDDDGELVIHGGESYESETLYGIRETRAPEHYLLPLKEEWHYFYFCNDKYLEPSILANLPEGATAIDLTENGARITVDNQKEIITIPVMKIWQGPAWPDNAEILVGLYQSVAGSEAVPVLNEDGTPKTVILTSDAPFNNKTFSGLPSRDGNNNIVYSIKEENISGIAPLDAGYIQEYGVSGSGVYIVRNKPATTLTVSKQWYDLNGNQVTDPDTLEEQSSVTFDVYRSSTPFEDRNPEDGITNAEMTAFVSTLTRVRENLTFGASDDWSMSIRDLDKQDDMGNRYYYYVLETVPSFGYELYEVDVETGTVTIKNKIAPERVKLTVTKAELVGDPRPESLDREFAFTLKLKVDDTHPVRSWKVYTDPANPSNDLVTDSHGEATFTLKPTNPDHQPTTGASITLSLPVNVTAMITEAYNTEYTVKTDASVEGTTGDSGRTFSYITDSETDEVTLTYTNTLHVVCKVVDDQGNQTPFESLKSALKHIRENSDSFTSSWAIYMLEDYVIPSTDGIDLREGEELTLTTAAIDDRLFPFHPGKEPERAVITRGGDGGSMLKNAGTLTLENICLDGGNKSNLSADGDGGLVNSIGTLNLNDGTTLRNSTVSGKGGAVYAEGTVNIVDGVKITGNSAPNASALYLKGTLNMTGGEISDNTGASDGAVVAARTIDQVNLSGKSVIFGNTNVQGKAANLYIGADSDNIINVVSPGLAEEAHIGVTAMDGHMGIGEQFASAEFGQTSNLGCFVNDTFGYRGKLRDGTSTNVIWDGLTIKIKKDVSPVGANPNDRFTITLSSYSITMSTYVIDGTLNYTVSPARKNRPGMITLNNVKEDDLISILPLPVGEYKIAEEASNYNPGYTLTTESGEPGTIDNGIFTADNDSTVTVTNTRRLAPVKLTKTLDDRLAGEASVDFDFTVLLTEQDGSPVAGFPLKTDGEGTPVSDFITDENGEVKFTMQPTDAADAIQEFQTPVGATMTITETVNPNYRIAVSALTKAMSAEKEGKEIENLNTTDGNVFAFQVTDEGVDVTFNNVRKMAEIELSKTLVGKVSKEESFTFTLTLTNGTTPVANYIAYRDETNPENNITTNDSGAATVTFTFKENETEAKSVLLTIPDGTKLVVAETEVKKNINGTEQPIYNTKYSVNDGSAKTGLTATISKVSDTDHSIAFTNTRKTNTITVKNTVSGYSGNVVPFTYTATVTDGDETQDDYDLNEFTDGEMTFELTSGQTRTLTVPYGATLNISQGFVVGYDTTVKRGSAAAIATREIEYVVSVNETDAFTNTQLIALVLKNECSNDLTATVYVSTSTFMKRVNDTQDDYIDVSLVNKMASVTVEAGKTAVLEVAYNASQTYSVSGPGPKKGYYYTIKNEPAYHEDARPAIMRVYDTDSYSVSGNLKYGPTDSYVQFTEQPLVSFDSNGGVWTTQMDGYRDRDGDRKVYQKAVTSGETAARPTPDPVYPTAEGIAILGWTEDETFAKAGHTAGEDISAMAYDFDTPVTRPVMLYAVWAKPAREYRVVTVANGHNEDLTVTATLTNAGDAVSDYVLFEDPDNPDHKIITNADGEAGFILAAGESKNLTVPDGVKLDLGLEKESLAESLEFNLAASADNKSFTIAKVDRDGTVTFIPGICKITDGEGNVLYDNNGKPTVYGTLSAAFTDYAGTLYTEASHTTVATQAAVKMLVDEYTIRQSAALTFPNKKMILTTASKNDTDFPYMGQKDRSTIYRAANGVDNSCFTLSSAAEVTLTNIILDGGSERGIKVNDGKNGALINVTNAGATLKITTNATLRNVEYKAYTSNANGGAVYMTNGTLNVNAGQFSNLHALRGGAICVTGGTLNITGTSGSTQFEDCCSEKQDGGAIYYNCAKDLLIDGGSEKDNPGIIFTRCVATYTNGTSDGGDGGAIFATSNYTNTVTVKGCSFIECSARTGNSASTSGYGGGGICGYKVKGLTVEACTFEACDTLCGGGAVATIVKYTETVDNETVNVKNCTFNQCNSKGQAGALGVYQDDNGKTNCATKLSVIDSTFNNCSSGTNNGSGGAIQCYLPCMVFTDSHFTDCWAGKEGGAVNNFFANKYGDMWPNSSLKVEQCTFTRCRAEDRYQADQMQHYGGAINTKVKTVTVTESTFTDCVSTLREGGALHLGGIGTGSSASITGSTFINCMAKTSGGAVMASTNTLTVSDSFFYGCQAFGKPESNYKYDNANKKNQNGGGAISHSENSRNNSTQGTTTITNCVFTADPDGDEDAQSCSTATNGGAIWTRASSVEIRGCIIDGGVANENGGGIYLSKNSSQSATIASNEINNMEGEKIVVGSITNCQAVSGSAVYAEDKATFFGDLNVSGNIVSDVNSGAIQTVNTGKLYFEGNVRVENNSCSADSTNKHDVLMQINGNSIINTTSSGLGFGANIGVYVSDPNSAYENHGKEGQPFGTYHNSDAGSNFLDAFFNDRDNELRGYQGMGDSYIYWGIYVCKITDADGNTLKRPNGRDAVYQRLSMAFDEFTSVTGGKPVYIKMLIEDYVLRQDTAISNIPSGEDITLTTASRSDTSHPYRGREGTVSTIYRTNSENPLFSLGTEAEGAVFQLKDIILDGRKDKTAAEGDYKLINAAAGKIIVNSGTTLQYAKGETGAAITGVNVTINGTYDTEKNEPTVKIANCTATHRGGAISTQNLTITNNGTGSGEYGTAFIHCTSGNGGGAIYAGGTTVSMDGAVFTECNSTGEGGVLFHDNAMADTIIKKSAFIGAYTTGSAGGAVSSIASNLTVENSLFDACHTPQNGGAINHTGTAAAAITGTTFKGCYTNGSDSSSGFGGSVYTKANNVDIMGSEFQDSTAANHGGALYCASVVDGSTAVISGTSFDHCATIRSEDGYGGAIYSLNKSLTLQDYILEGSAARKTSTTVNSCSATGRSGAVYMVTDGSVLTIKGSTVISNCYAKMGGAVYLPEDVTLSLNGSPEFTQNGYTVQGGSVVDADAGACIYLAQGSRINLADSPKFSRNILPNKPRITNGGIYDNVRQDIYLAGYESISAESIYVVGDLTGDTIWVWPEMSPHRLPSEQFARIDDGVKVSPDSLSKLRNSLADVATHCSNGEYLAGVQISAENKNIYWDKVYAVTFRKIDNKGVTVPGAEFTLYKDSDCTDSVATAVSADGENDTDAQGKLLPRGTVEFTSIRIGVYYMKETKVPISFKDNPATYLVLVGTPFLSPNDDNRYLWEGNGPLNVADAATLVARHTTDAGKYYGVFPLDENNKAVLRANLASNSVGIENIRNDYQVSFMKTDSFGDALPGAAFTIYSAILDSEGQPETFKDGYPMLMLWSRDGESYPAPVVSADGTDAFKDKYNNRLPKGTVYFRELPLGTYYLLETAYPERNGKGRRTYYMESDRVLRLELTEDTNDPLNINVTLSEWKYDSETGFAYYEDLPKDEQGNYLVSNREVVCKLTDTENNLLYVKGHEVWENKSESTVRLLPAIYPTLEEGFEAAQTGSFVYENGNEADVDTGLKLKVLKDFTLSEPVTYNSSRSITFTTAETKVIKDRYIFSTTRTTDTERALISRAYNQEENSADANAGALITLTGDADMTLEKIRLNGQKSSYNGRAIHVSGGSNLTILSDTRIENCTQTAAADSTGGSDLKGGAILMDDGTSLTIDGGYNRTAIFSGNAVVNNRTDGNTGSDGGAIAVGANCTFSITNAQFTGNSAAAQAEKKGNGGAISISQTVDVPLNNVVFSNNSASYQGGALCAAENCSLAVDNCVFSNNQANINRGSGEGGAIAVLSRQDAPSAVTISGGSFTGNTAVGGKGGAVKIGAYGTLALGGSLIMSGNTAEDGGAVTVDPGANVTMTQGTLRGNTATGNGGAFYVNGRQEDNQPVRGNLTVSGSSITSNTAGLGSAVYIADNASLTVTDASFTGNTAWGTDGGAINVGGVNARLYFGGSPTVFDNYGSLGEHQQMNLVLSGDSNGVINTTTDGLESGIIGVYVVVPDPNSSDDTIFTEHGLPGKPFGTFGDADRSNPQVFRSDHTLSLYGVRNENDENDSLIYWVDVICKLTDSNDRILYQDIDLMINGRKETRKAQAVYARITEYDDSDAVVANGFNALRDGFSAAQGKLYSRNGDNYTEYSDTSQTTVKLKMLKDNDLDKSIQYQGSRMVTFTTAETEDDLTEQEIQKMRSRGDFFLFYTDRMDAEGKALIQRAFDENSMIVDKGTNLTLTGIVLDGADSQYTVNANGGIVNCTKDSKLTISEDAVLQNSASGLNGGAVYVVDGATMEMTGGKITACSAATGAGIYLAEGATLKLSGMPDFGGPGATATEIDSNVGNFATTPDPDLGSDATNGQLSYTRARQDIYVGGYQTEGSAASSIVIAGPLGRTVGTTFTPIAPGSIWVWTQEEEHYKMLKQFAVFENGGVKSQMSPEQLAGTLAAFRNAVADDASECGADYLTGQEGADIGDWKCIYWTGGFDFVFMKTNGDGAALDGATFTLYKSRTDGSDIQVEGEDNVRVAFEKSGAPVTGTSAQIEDVNAVTIKVKVEGEPGTDPTAVDKKVYGDGLVHFEKIPPGTYFVVETTAPAIRSAAEGENSADIPVWESVEEKYKIVLDGKGYYTMYVPGRDAEGRPDWMEAPVTSFKNDGSDKYTIPTASSTDDKIAVYTVMNISPLKRKVILRKTNETYDPLNGAKFTVYYADKQTVVKIKHNTGTGETVETLQDLTSGTSGAFWIGELPFGTYYLEETAAPSASGYTKPDKYFVLTVDENGVTQLPATKAAGSTQSANELKASSRPEDSVESEDGRKTMNAPRPATTHSTTAPKAGNQSTSKTGKLSLPKLQTSSPLSAQANVEAATEAASSDNKMWGSVTGDVSMDTSKDTYSIEDGDDELEGKTAYVWPEESWEDLGYMPNRDYFNASAGTLVRYDGKFRLLTEDFAGDVRELGAIKDHSIELSERPTILTDADFTNKDATAYPKEVDVSKETVLYSDGKDYWVLVQSGVPQKPDEDAKGWIKLSDVLKRQSNG